jgi:hypothetical protein
MRRFNAQHQPITSSTATDTDAPLTRTGTTTDSTPVDVTFPIPADEGSYTLEGRFAAYDATNELGASLYFNGGVTRQGDGTLMLQSGSGGGVLGDDTSGEFSYTTDVSDDDIVFHLQGPDGITGQWFLKLWIDEAAATPPESGAFAMAWW